MSGPVRSEGLTLAVVAKECVPGRVKTRLHPPLSLAAAADVASACLADTLATLADVPAARRVLFLDGRADDPGTLPPEARTWEVLPQPEGTLDVRLAHLFDVVAGPLLLVGMDTPQLTVGDLALALGSLLTTSGPVRSVDDPDSVTLDDRDADGSARAVRALPAAPDVWLGPAQDGGYWALAISARADRTLVRAGAGRGELVRGVPMSRDDTGRLQRERLVAHGLSVGTLPTLVDIDAVDDLLEVVPLARRGGALERWARSVGPLSVAPPRVGARSEPRPAAAR